MENFTISLRQKDGKDKKFTTPNHINGLLFRKAAEIAEMIEDGRGTEGHDLDAAISFVCELYDTKFTIEEFEEGTDARRIIRTVYAAVNFVMGNVAEASKLLEGDNPEDESGESD